MAKLIVNIPDELVSQVTSASYSVESVVLKALIQYLANGLPSQNIMQTRTWQLCGRFAVSDAHAIESTNYAEQVDDVLYQGF
jgi:hypothetical protein